MNYEIIRNANPWSKMADAWLAEMRTGNRNYDFVLPQDKSVLNGYKPTDPSRHQLLRNIPAEPFVGNPEANIWFLLKNPGGGEWNECDFLCGKKGLSEENMQFATPRADADIDRRRELYARQLKLDGVVDNEFYLLDPSFCTAQRGGRMPRCIYWWYRTRLLCNEGIFSPFVDNEDEKEILRFCSRNVFVLDYFPYHSSWFDDVDLKVAHSDFWHLAVGEALKDPDKMFVFWGSKSSLKNKLNTVRHFRALPHAIISAWNRRNSGRHNTTFSTRQSSFRHLPI